MQCSHQSYFLPVWATSLRTFELFTTDISASQSATSTFLHNDFLINSHCLYHFLSDCPSVSRLISALSPLHHQLREETHTHTHLLVTVTLEHHISGQRTKSSAAGGDSFFDRLARILTFHLVRMKRARRKYQRSSRVHSRDHRPPGA